MNRKEREKRASKVASFRKTAEVMQGKQSRAFKLPSGFPRFIPKAGVYQLDIIGYTLNANRSDADEGSLVACCPYEAHRGVGARQDTFLCPMSVGKPCAICEKRRDLGNEIGWTTDTVRNMKASKRALITGGAITGGALAIGALSGGSVLAPLAQSVPQLFNGTPTSKDTARAGGVETPFEFAEAQTLQDALSGGNYGGTNGTGVFDGLFSLAGLDQNGVIPQGPNILEDPAGSVFRPSGGSDDGGFTLTNGNEDPEAGGNGIFQNKAAWAIGGIAVLFLLSRRKSG